ncbi:hypothetical protein BaRGS_00002898 [Batillaria attramentaria]|uniref:Uncharacterized protein n=1 Tax=Batillaria attramentaria TaxID=370345 RepID=A0ABD0M1Y4_9CAEN
MQKLTVESRFPKLLHQITVYVVIKPLCTQPKRPLSDGNKPQSIMQFLPQQHDRRHGEYDTESSDVLWFGLGDAGLKVLQGGNSTCIL